MTQLTASRKKTDCTFFLRLHTPEEALQGRCIMRSNACHLLTKNVSLSVMRKYGVCRHGAPTHHGAVMWVPSSLGELPCSPIRQQQHMQQRALGAP